MNLGRPLSFVSFLASFILAAAGGCDGTEGTTSACAAGNERCACYPNKTCNKNLVCLSNICVDDTGAAGNENAAGGGAGEEGGTASSAGQTATGSGGTDPGTTVGQGGATTTVAQGGTTVITAQGGATTTVAQGGTTVITGQGGTTVIGSGGTTVIGAGGTLASGGTTVAAGGAAVLVLGPNLVSNGDFSQGTAFWHVRGVTTSGGVDLTTGSVGTDEAYCIAYSTSYTSNVIGWPVVVANTITLKPSTTYAFNYRIMGPSTHTVAFKVGLFASPYTAIASASATTLTATWKELRSTFTTLSSQSTASQYGLAFTLTGSYTGQICIDDVVLAEVVGTL